MQSRARRKTAPRRSAPRYLNFELSCVCLHVNKLNTYVPAQYYNYYILERATYHTLSGNTHSGY